MIITQISKPSAQNVYVSCNSYCYFFESNQSGVAYEIIPDKKACNIVSQYSRHKGNTFSRESKVGIRKRN